MNEQIRTNVLSADATIGLSSVLEGEVFSSTAFCFVNDS
jgi:hypothetical protein